MKEKVTSHIVVNTRTLLFFDICRKNKYLTISVCPQILVNRITQERCALQTLDLICRSAVRRTGHTELSFQKKKFGKNSTFSTFERTKLMVASIYEFFGIIWKSVILSFWIIKYDKYQFEKYFFFEEKEES